MPRIDWQTQGWIDWKWEIDEIERFLRAFSFEKAGALSRKTSSSSIYKLSGARIHERRTVHPFQAGIIFSKKNNEIFCYVKGGVLAIKEINQLDGTSLRKFCKLGDRFYTTSKDLDESFSKRAFYFPDGRKELR